VPTNQTKSEILCADCGRGSRYRPLQCLVNLFSGEQVKKEGSRGTSRDWPEGSAYESVGLHFSESAPTKKMPSRLLTTQSARRTHPKLRQPRPPRAEGNPERPALPPPLLCRFVLVVGHPFLCPFSWSGVLAPRRRPTTPDHYPFFLAWRLDCGRASISPPPQPCSLPTDRCAPLFSG
jgi:hypothetical protein